MSHEAAKVIAWQTNTTASTNKVSSITVQLCDQTEVEIFRRYLRGESNIRKCPVCGHDIKIDGESAIATLEVANPMVAPMTEQLATAIYKCPVRETDMKLDMLYCDPFPSLLALLAMLRTKNEEKLGDLNEVSGETR